MPELQFSAHSVFALFVVKKHSFHSLNEAPGSSLHFASVLMVVLWGELTFKVPANLDASRKW